MFCATCGGGESLEDNKVILCDGCDVAVHQFCYGIPKVLKGKWFCDKCKWQKAAVTGSQSSSSASSATASASAAGGAHRPSPPSPITCHFCLQSNGAMKSSKDKTLWGHVTCVWYDPNAFFKDPARMAPIIFHRVKQQVKECVCGICKKEGGLAIPCRWPECQTKVHARCVGMVI